MLKFSSILTKKYKHYILSLSILCLGFQQVIAAEFEPELGEPVYSLVDRNFVNVPSKSIYYNLTDVSIGEGALALTHSITLNSTNILNHGSTDYEVPRFWGYKDKYVAGIYRTLHTSNINKYIPDTTTQMSEFYVLNVSDDIATYQFYVTDNGEFKLIGKNKTFITLEVLSDRKGYLLTRSDGTQVFYRTKGDVTIPQDIDSTYEAYGIMEKIVYPNGLTIDIHRKSPVVGIQSPVRSVTTNNGLQLKYIYEDDLRAVPTETQQKLDEAGKINQALNFSQYMPKRIIAINNSVERCPILADTCSLTHEWPTVEYTWPIAVPYSMYVEDTIFKVEDALGTTTEFHHFPFTGSFLFSMPRINRIKNNKGLDVFYDYSPSINCSDDNPCGYVSYLRSKSLRAGVIDGANGLGGNLSYQVYGSKLAPAYGSDTEYSYSSVNSYKGVKSYTTMFHSSYEFNSEIRAVSTAPYKIELWNQTITLEKNFSNKVTQIESNLDGTSTSFEYDNDERLVEIDRDGLLKKNEYQYIYNGQCSNRKTCIKPTSVSDWYFEWGGETRVYTDYQYHSGSGGVEKVTYPVDNYGKQRVVVNNYQQYYARYLTDSGSLVTSTAPIWLISSTYECKNSNLVNYECEGDDKVTTTYHYGSGSTANNLFLIGETIRAEDGTDTRTYCFKYDRYGNEIETSSPKSGVTDCNVNREIN